MTVMTRLFFSLGALFVAIFLSACVSNSINNKIEASANYKEGEFINSEPFEQPGLGKTLAIIKRFIFMACVDSLQTWKKLRRS